MRKKMVKLAWALLVLAGGLTATLAPQNAEALTCREQLDECTAACAPEDTYCAELCQCEFLNCRGYQCN